ncbi:hypothetical protein HHI36_006200 [Cryptolaemus montrouzieri]|uniref:Uncharacterized protein n=1 Tax=Cryptolaemus montrouzieri TaxID=559131 RepID=A0ABD2NWD7_9CUCU
MLEDIVSMMNHAPSFEISRTKNDQCKNKMKENSCSTFRCPLVKTLSEIDRNKTLTLLFLLYRNKVHISTSKSPLSACLFDDKITHQPFSCRLAPRVNSLKNFSSLISVCKNDFNELDSTR